MKFYDTNALLELQEKVFEEFFLISSVTLQELEEIKTNRNKDDEVKYRARKITKLLNDYSDQDKYFVVICKRDGSKSNDEEIISDAVFARDTFSEKTHSYTGDGSLDLTFITNDVSCKMLAKYISNLKVESTYTDEIDNYKGYKEVVMSDDELCDFYTDMSANKFELLTNEYLIIKNVNGTVIDKLRWDGNEFQVIKFPTIKSEMFGAVKPYNGDLYQQLVLNSLSTNKITMVKGAAGTGKSFLAIGYMLWLLEKHKIDKIIIFANPTPTANAAKLGFLPGTQLEKLTDSSLGNMLGAKLGDKYMIDQLVNQNKLDILPMCDIRGFDTSGLNCAVYITEAQNLDISLMKLALQRVGEDSIVIIDGDYNAQVDLTQYSGHNNGMRRLSQIFRGQDFYGEIELKNIYRGRIARLAELM